MFSTLVMAIVAALVVGLMANPHTSVQNKMIEMSTTPQTSRSANLEISRPKRALIGPPCSLSHCENACRQNNFKYGKCVSYTHCTCQNSMLYFSL